VGFSFPNRHSILVCGKKKRTNFLLNYYFTCDCEFNIIIIIIIVINERSVSANDAAEISALVFTTER
jgi:hypothetical protein